MYTQSLKTNIAVQLVMLFLMAMILTGFVMIILMQKALIRSEISRGYAFLSALEVNNQIYSKSKNVIMPSDYQDDFAKVLSDTRFSCILVMDVNQNIVYSGGKGCKLHDELETMTRQTIQSGKKTTRFFGENGSFG